MATATKSPAHSNTSKTKSPSSLANKSRYQRLSEYESAALPAKAPRTVGGRKAVVPNGLVTFLKNGTVALVVHNGKQFTTRLHRATGLYLPAADAPVVFDLSLSVVPERHSRSFEDISLYG